MPICSAKPFWNPYMFCDGSHTVSLPSAQAQAVVNNSMGLWCWVGVA